MTLPYDAIDQIRHDGGAFIELIGSNDGGLSVPSCPDWDLNDLAWHVGNVWNFWAAVVETRLDDVGDIRTIARPDRPEDDDFADFLHESHGRLCTTLHDTPAETAVWTWTGANRGVDWVQRRMAQEIAIHRWDAATTVGDPYVVPTAVAADGIDEFLMWHAAGDRSEGAVKVGGTVHLHCTDTDPDEVNGEWYIASMKEPSATFTREHRKADAAIRGEAHAILMWLWRRNGGPVEILGDKIVARRFQAFTDLS